MRIFSIFFLCLFTKIESAPKIHGPLTHHFSYWLDKHGYSRMRIQFKREDLGPYGSYGGRTYENQPIRHDPVIFIHGNSDQALDSGKRLGLTGWTHSIDYFLSKNYSSAELYATTWGPADLELADDQVHSCSYLQNLRQFTEAVIAYTGAKKVSMVSHSMGVTLARKVVRGGLHTDETGKDCDIGRPLTATVDTFIGICGGNRGLVECFTPPGDLLKACNDLNGFFPGVCLTAICKGNAPGLTTYLEKLNRKPHRMEGQHIYSMYSHGDIVIGYDNLVWGFPTSKIIGQDGEKVYTTYGHIECKDKTGAVQYNMIRSHIVI